VSYCIVYCSCTRVFWETSTIIFSELPTTFFKKVSISPGDSNALLHLTPHPFLSRCRPLFAVRRTADDVQWNAQGRNKAIVLGQVGIRCRYCSQIPTWSRARGAVYYSATLDGLYQAAQNMAKNHLCKRCRLIPDDVRDKITSLRVRKRRAVGGKKYWAEGARVLGVIQCEDSLRFKKREPATLSKMPKRKKNAKPNEQKRAGTKTSL
jgi:hypothetical protein